MSANKENKKNINFVRSPIATRSKKAVLTKKIQTPEKKRDPGPRKKVEKVSKVKSVVPQKVVRKTTKVDSKGATIESLDHNSLELIFEFVGPYDTLWNVRRVCKEWNRIAQKENLSSSFIKSQGWADDFAVSKELKEHKTCYEHCFQRVTVRKFFEKVAALSQRIIPLDKPFVPPTQAAIREEWENEMADLVHPETEEKVTLTLPWQYIEYRSSFPGICFDGEREFEDRVRHVEYHDDALVDGIHQKDEEGSAAWAVIGTYRTYQDVIICCDKESEDYGLISDWVTNCGDGKPLAQSLVELIRGLYFRFTGFMDKFKVDEAFMKWLFEDEELSETVFEELMLPGEWFDEDGKCCTEIPFSQEDLDEYIQERKELEAENEDEEEEGDEEEEKEEEEDGEEDEEEGEEDDD